MPCGEKNEFINKFSMAHRPLRADLMQLYIFNETEEAVAKLTALKQEHPGEHEVALYFWLAKAVASLKGETKQLNTFWRAVYELKKMGLLEVCEEELTAEGIGWFSKIEEMSSIETGPLDKIEKVYLEFTVKEKLFFFNTRGVLIVDGKEGKAIFEKRMKQVVEILVE